MGVTTIFPVLTGVAAFVLFLAFLIALVYATYQAIRSPVGPLSLVRRAWAVSFQYMRIDIKLVLLIAGAFALGQILQATFNAHPMMNDVPAILGLVWQCLLAVFLAVCAARFHLHLIGKLASEITDAEFALPQFRQIASRVGLWGGALWLVGYALFVVSNVAVQNSSVDLIRPVLVATSVLAYLLMAPFVSIRPAVAFGQAHPFWRSLEAARGNLLALLLILSLAVIPPALFELVIIDAIPSVPLLRTLLFVLFALVQFLAFEAATVLFFTNAVMRPVIRASAKT